jgi:glycosidase
VTRGIEGLSTGAAAALLLAALLAPAAARPAGPAVAPMAARAGAPADTAAWRLDWCRGAVFYEIFVRSFADSDGDGIGDFRGLSAKLDYLNDGNPATHDDLGVDALWLMPAFPSPSYHGYDVTDYEHVNPAYGTEAEFDSLLARTHRRGIRVIIDLVLNHTSAEHPWFRDSASSPGSRHRNWYVWRPDDPGWTQPWGQWPTWHRSGGAYYYGIFGGGMPDLNFRTPAVREEMKRIATLWLGRGVDGFRLDATRHLVEAGPGAGQNDSPETHAFLKELAAHVRRVKPDALLVGENWTDTKTIARYYGSTERIAGGDELPMSFDFPLASAIIEGVRDGDASRIVQTLAEIRAAYPAGVLDAPFLTNHDMVRLATQLAGDPGKLRAAAAILLTLPGSPFLYYGEEVGLANGPASGDEAKRTPMPWNAASGGGFTTGRPWFAFAPGRDSANVGLESGDPGSLLSRYRALIGARHASRALREGELRVIPTQEEGGPFLVYTCSIGEERVLVAHNLGATPASLPLPSLRAKGLGRLFAVSGAGAVRRAEGVVEISLPPLASGVWRLR